MNPAPREVAWVIMRYCRPGLRSHSFKLLSYLLDVAIDHNRLEVHVGRRRILRETGMCRKGYDVARRGLSGLIPILPGARNGVALTYDLRALWAAGLQGGPVQDTAARETLTPAEFRHIYMEGGPVSWSAGVGSNGGPVPWSHIPGSNGGPVAPGSNGGPVVPGGIPGLQGGPVPWSPAAPQIPGSNGGPVVPGGIPGLQGGPVQDTAAGLQGGPLFARTGPLEGPGLEFDTGPLGGPAFPDTGPLGGPGPESDTGPLGGPGPEKAGLQGGPVQNRTPGLQGGPLPFTPGLQGGPVQANKSESGGRDFKSDLKIDRSIPPSNSGEETREPTTAEIETAKTWLRMFRYSNNAVVVASSEACVYALKSAGSMERLNWALGKLAKRLESNPSWRPKGAKTLRPWLRKVIARELSTLDPAPETSESPAAAARQPVQSEMRGERVDTAAMISGLAGAAKRMK